MEGLSFQVIGAAIPEKGLVQVADVGQARAVAAAGSAVDAFAQRAPVAKSQGRLMAGAAGDGGVRGKDGVEEEAAAQGEAFPGGGVVLRIEHGRHARWFRYVQGLLLTRSVGSPTTINRARTR